MLRVLILIGALVAGGLAAWLSRSMLISPPPVVTTVQPVAAPTLPVLVATADIAQGEKLSEANLRWQSWPEEAVNSGFITRTAKPDAVEALNGSIVRSRFVAGEPILEEKLVQTNSSFLAANLAPGMRAVAIRVSPESSAGGFILPNNRVDVIHTTTRQGQGGGPGEVMGQTILRNVRVLAIDQKSNEVVGEATVIGKTATLELSSAQAEIIAGAQASGILSLALRSVEDLGEVPTAPVVHRESPVSVRVLRAGRSETVTIR